MRYHDDQTVACYLLEYLHYLNAGFGVKRSGRLVGKQNVGVVYQRAGDGDTLHLTAGHLVGLFVKLIAQSHTLKHCLGTATAFGAIHTRNGKGKLNVCKHRLMRYQVVALKDKAYRMVSVGVPFAVREGRSRFSVYFELT